MKDGIIAALIAAIASLLAVLVKVYYDFRQLKRNSENRLAELEKASEVRAREDEQREAMRVRLRYLNPLLITTMDLRERLIPLVQELSKGDQQRQRLVGQFNKIKDQAMSGAQIGDFLYWCNGEGYFTMSTLFVTNSYFAQAAKIRSELPFIRLTAASDRELLDRLTAVRTSFGGEYGIWEVLQDSLGEFLRRPDGSVRNYREFCQLICDRDDHRWFLRLMDFYRDADKKEGDFRRINGALASLIDLLQGHIAESKKLLPQEPSEPTI